MTNGCRRVGRWAAALITDMSATPNRRPAGLPTGGQFAPTSHAESTAVLDVSRPETATAAGSPCAKCGTPTKRSSGLCRRCDPASKANRAGPQVRSPGGRSGRGAGDGPVVDISAGPVPAERIVACAYDYVPVYRGGVATGAFRRCANAVVAPETFCHRHGGAPSASLGRSVAKASAEAARGECFPLAASHWESAEARLEAAEGRLLAILGTDTSALAEMMVAFRGAHSTSSVGRMSPSNQMLVLVQHWLEANKEGLSGEEAFRRAVELSGEPHMTAANWAKAGRAPLPGASPVAALWWKPGSTPPQEPGESDEDYAERAARARRGYHGAVMEYPLSATDGEPFEIPDDPIGSFRPGGYGDPEKAISTMEALAAESRIGVAYTDRRPADGAYAYWSAAESQIVVWRGIADGDRRAVAHSLAHELGHARLGHSTSDSHEKHRADKEAAAESFAALVCAHHGIDTAELSAHYVSDWRRAQGIDMRAGGMAPMRSAVAAFDDYVTATAPPAA